MNQIQTKPERRVGIVTRYMKENVIPFLSAISGFGETVELQDKELQTALEQIEKVSDQDFIHTREKNTQEVHIPLEDEPVVKRAKVNEKKAGELAHAKQKGNTRRMEENELGK